MRVTLNFKTDKKIKDEAKKVARELGLPLGTIMNHYLRELVREKRVIFAEHPKLSNKTINELEEISNDIKTGKNISPAFKNSEEAIRWLNS